MRCAHLTLASGVPSEVTLTGVRYGQRIRVSVYGDSDFPVYVRADGEAAEVAGDDTQVLPGGAAGQLDLSGSDEYLLVEDPDRPGTGTVTLSLISAGSPQISIEALP